MLLLRVQLPNLLGSRSHAPLALDAVLNDALQAALIDACCVLLLRGLDGEPVAAWIISDARIEGFRETVWE